MIEYPIWPEAEIINSPKKKQDEPLVLVRRRMSGLIGANGEDIFVASGQTVISLFTGAGGMDLGMEQAGFSILVQHEYDESACLTLIANRPGYFTHAALIQGDIRKTPTSMLLAEAGLRVGELDVIVGGPPCQGFSTANAKANRGRYDVRNDLVFQYLRVVSEAKPKFFIFENVPGFLSFNKGEYFKAFLRAAYNCYYELVYGLLDAVEYLVPQYRVRFFCMGTRRDMFEIEGVLCGLPKPICFSDKDLLKLKDIKGFPLLFQGEEDLLIHAPGIRYFHDRPILFPPRPIHNGHRSKKFVEFYRELECNEPDRIVREPRA